MKFFAKCDEHFFQQYIRCEILDLRWDINVKLPRPSRGKISTLLAKNTAKSRVLFCYIWWATFHHKNL